VYRARFHINIIRETLYKVEVTQNNIHDIISKIKKETNIRDKVDLNIKLQKLNSEIVDLKGNL